ncbi:hypothetical protein F0562_033768 [Nyssa sinensis]|uniref:Phytochrome kinase substrate 1 n=1 Tax=Nyssa sinensis TaxID=561372 RepID=A0A5J5AEK9_9ASTE|nr:hypothetical protein F0562_033768 [Nyssa sinensis]
MAMVTLTSPCNTKHLHDASISSYLNNAEETFVVKLAESSPALSSLITTPNEHLCLGRKKFEDGEIGVFGAEKYFNGGTDEEKPRIANKGAIKHQYKKDDPVDTGPVKPKTQPGTPSAYSESSWNSQSAFLHGVQTNPPPRKTNKVHGKSFLSSLGCNCPCGDKNSVDVDETTSNKSVSFRVVPGKTIPKEPIKTGLDSRLNPWIEEEMPCNELGLGLKREDRFSFPVLNSKAGNLEEEDDNKPRKSLEVFGSPMEKGKKTLSLERKLTMLSWDAKARAEETDIPASSDRIFNETGSDASSDLFEIESFTNNANSFLTRQASDGGMSSCVTPTTCYAPSEASIEWSVVTASAADFSAMSDSEEPRTAATATNPQQNGSDSQNYAEGRDTKAASQVGFVMYFTCSSNEFQK